MEFNIKKRWYSKEHRRQYIKTSWLERLGENILEGIAKDNPKAFLVAKAVIGHLESNRLFYKEV